MPIAETVLLERNVKIFHPTLINLYGCKIGGGHQGRRLRPEYRPERAVNAVPRRSADTSKAQKVLGFRARVDLEEGLSRLVNWWRSQRRLAAAS